jgi:16S rRNA (guanine966-N2)-methyltransferase
MRVIAGECKGRQLKPVPGRTTRPTTDKVKESIFNMIGPFFDGGLGLDLYSGSGGLGLEGLSRGLDKVIFVDRDPKAIGRVKWNISQCGFHEKAEVYRNNAQLALKAVMKRGLQFRIIFLDPPYFKQKLTADLETIGENNLLEDRGIIVVEHHTEVTLPETAGSLQLKQEETYGGKTVVSIYGVIT